MNKNLTGFVFGGCACLMLGLAFAAKPMYDTFCRVTGFGGTTREATAAPTEILDRVINVRLDSNINGLPFRFRPLQPLTKTRVGETNLVFFEVTNPSDEPISAIASYNVAPHKTGPYFSKIECFCYEEQVFQPGESKILPVVFFIDPLIAEERLLDDIKTITLSYTYFRAKDGIETLASFNDLVSEH